MPNRAPVADNLTRLSHQGRSLYARDNGGRRTYPQFWFNFPSVIMISREIEIINKLGLHARAAAKLVTTASQFQSEITLERNQQRVNGKSIMGVMMLAASQGTLLTLTVDGNDEADAADTLEALVKDRFGEGE